jgi:7-cyano-7-deazaguanine synthase
MPAVAKPAVVLLSGGLDSATVLSMAIRDGFQPYAISFRYGQRHQVEIDRARRLADSMRVAQHKVVDFNLSLFGGSALTDVRFDVPKHQSVEAIGNDIPVTYVPARNTIFLSFALSWAEAIGATDIFIGVNALDYSGYPDCRPEYIAAYEHMANLATKAGTDYAKSGIGEPIRIRTPLISMTKAEIIRAGLELGVDYSQTLSCYDPVEGELACGHCDACLLRLRGFAQNGIPDPSRYVTL